LKRGSVMKCGGPLLPPSPGDRYESQRDSIHQPSVATQELRWETRR